MKKTILALTAAGLLSLAAHAQDAPRTTYGDVARVLSAKPVYDKAPASRECRLENTGYSNAATEIPHCDEGSGKRERIVGYDVTYQYHGREFFIRMPTDPGEQMAVNVDVRPPMPGPRPGFPNPRYRGPY